VRGCNGERGNCCPPPPPPIDLPIVASGASDVASDALSLTVVEARKGAVAVALQTKR